MVSVPKLTIPPAGSVRLAQIRLGLHYPEMVESLMVRVPLLAIRLWQARKYIVAVDGHTGKSNVAPHW